MKASHGRTKMMENRAAWLLWGSVIAAVMAIEQREKMMAGGAWMVDGR